MKNLSSKNIILSVIIISVCVLLFAGVSHASVGIPSEYMPQNAPDIPGQDGDYGTTSIQILIGKIISVLLIAGGVLAIHYIISNAFWIMSSAGSQETIEKGKKGLFWAIVGLVLIIISYIAVRFLIELLIAAGNEEEPAPPPPSSSVIYELAKAPSDMSS